jgi:Leucine-rich repeat (LRR) protein
MATSAASGQSRLLALPALPREHIFDYVCDDMETICAMRAVSCIFNLQLREFLKVNVEALLRYTSESSSLIFENSHGIRIEDALLQRLSASSGWPDQNSIEPALSLSDQDYTGYRVYLVFCRSVASAVRSVIHPRRAHASTKNLPEVVVSVPQVLIWERSVLEAQDISLQKVWHDISREIDSLASTPQYRALGEELPNEQMPAIEIRSWMQGHVDLLQEIDSLDLSRNFVYAAPLEIGLLTGLQTLCFNQNHLRSVFPGLLGNLPNLTELSFAENELFRIPPGAFDGLTGLVTLNLGWNRLTSIAPGVFSRLVSLTSLDLSLNGLDTLHPDLFMGLSRLSHLHLGDNFLITLPFDPLIQMPSLTSLNLSGNDDLTLPDPLLHRLSQLPSFQIDPEIVSDSEANED